MCFWVCHTRDRKQDKGLTMWALRNLKRFFPIAREILLPVSGAAWTWFFAVAVLRLEPFVVLNRIAVVCMFMGCMQRDNL